MRVDDQARADPVALGLVLTDAKIGVFTYPYDPSLVQNRCFLYHLIGNKTGEWKVPVGGMGAVARELENAARKSGAEFLTNVDLRTLDVNGKKRSVTTTRNAGTITSGTNRRIARTVAGMKNGVNASIAISPDWIANGNGNTGAGGTSIRTRTIGPGYLRLRRDLR